MLRRFVPIAVLLMGSACGKLQGEQFGEPPCPTWDDAVQPLLSSNCESCHGLETAEAGYRVDGYGNTLARRPDGTARLTPGDADSAFVQAIRGELAEHPAIAEADRAVLEDWSMRCRAAPRGLRVHTQAWATPTDPEFHGSVLRKSGYQLEACKDCHGADLAGGATQVSCTSGCHEKGVMDCATCHGGSPWKSLSGATATTVIGVGAHERHLGFGCATCHVSPENPEADGHYRRDGAPDVDGAELAFAAMAGPNAAFDRENATCTTKCHQPSPEDTAAKNRNPVWTQVGEGLKCSSCHGMAPATGAHLAHSKASRFRGPIGCGECHLSPKGGVMAAGHLDDSPRAEVFPLIDGVGAVARADNAQTAFDPATGTCTTYCHGSGEKGLQDQTPGRVLNPSWAGDESQAQCGSCHGLPPQDGLHAEGMALTDCAMCHAPTMDSTGQLKFTTDPATGKVSSTHLDGEVSLGIGRD